MSCLSLLTLSQPFINETLVALYSLWSFGTGVDKRLFSKLAKYSSMFFVIDYEQCKTLIVCFSFSI